MSTLTPSVEFRQINEEEAGQRLDNFLLRILKGVPKSRIYRAISKGEVRINKKRADASSRIKAGDLIRIPPIRVAQRPIVSLKPHLAELLADCILYEDNALIVLNKPSGFAVHGGSGLSLGIIEALRLLYPNEKNLELVHRLDKDTSGCLMVAKKRSMLRFLHQALREGHIEKKYWALLIGRWPAHQTVIDAPLQKNILSSGERMVRIDMEGKSAQTLFHVEQYFAEQTLASITLLTGRTHQIRVHAAHQGHPVAGDDKYGDKNANLILRQHGLKRLFLHAAQLVIPTLTDEKITIQAPLDEKLSELLTRLP